MRALTLAFLVATLACTPSPSEAEPVAQATKEPAPSPTEKAEATPVATVGQAAPDFTLKDLEGKSHSLSDHKGKTVVLEWFNPDCPYVVAAYDGGPMSELIQESREQGVVWLTINSGAPGKQGHGVERNKQASEDWSMPQPILLDEDGTVGRAYDAKVTPHMYVINPEGVLTYAGALDNAPRNKIPSDGHLTFTRDALTATLAGEEVRASRTQAWGCTVKYGS
ncbi:MAG: thioredoxin family protein [Deltaproteobacteria bacterium]|nr:MAG: thioredoxin family protein [Deltaproteobacteria bacterium]